MESSMKKYILILLFLTVSLFPRSDALIVGVGYYKNNIPSLWGVEKDVQNIQKLFKHLGVDHIQTLTNKQATLNGIREIFNRYINSPKNNPNNIFIFYYSGHGVQVYDIDGDEPDKKDEATALFDLALEDNQDVITGGLLLDDELYTILGKIKSKKILILDKCHSDSSHRGRVIRALPTTYSLSKEFWQKIKPKSNAKNALTNFVLFSATKANEEAEDSPFGGLFTNSIIDGILYKKADLNSDGTITVKELEQFCNHDISELATNINNKGYGGGLKGDFTPQFRPTEILNHSIASVFNIKKLTPKPKQSIEIVEEISPTDYLLEDLLDSLTSNDIMQLKLLFNKKVYREHERVRFKINSSFGGYLSIFIAYQDSYRLFMTNQKIEASKQYSFPNSFFARKHLVAKKPYGTTKIYAILSRIPLNIESYLSNNSLDKVREDLSLVNRFRKGVMMTYNNKGKPQREAEILGIGGVEFEVWEK